MSAGGITGATVRVYVNERGVDVPGDGTALDAVRLLYPDRAREIEAGEARLTDSRGLPIDAATCAHGGMILRVLPVRAAIASDE